MRAATHRADAVLGRALQGALAKRRVLFAGPELTNLTDAVTARLMDAGVDLWALDDVLSKGNPALIDREEAAA